MKSVIRVNGAHLHPWSMLLASNFICSCREFTMYIFHRIEKITAGSISRVPFDKIQTILQK